MQSPADTYDKLRSRKLSLCPKGLTDFRHDDAMLRRMMHDVPDKTGLPERCLSLLAVNKIDDEHGVLAIDAVVQVALFDPRDLDNAIFKTLHKYPCIYCPVPCYHAWCTPP